MLVFLYGMYNSFQFYSVEDKSTTYIYIYMWIMINCGIYAPFCALSPTVHAIPNSLLSKYVTYLMMRLFETKYMLGLVNMNKILDVGLSNNGCRIKWFGPIYIKLSFIFMWHWYSSGLELWRSLKEKKMYDFIYFTLQMMQDCI